MFIYVYIHEAYAPIQTSRNPSANPCVNLCTTTPRVCYMATALTDIAGIDTPPAGHAFAERLQAHLEVCVCVCVCARSTCEYGWVSAGVRGR